MQMKNFHWSNKFDVQNSIYFRNAEYVSEKVMTPHYYYVMAVIWDSILLVYVSVRRIYRRVTGSVPAVNPLRREEQETTTTLKTCLDLSLRRAVMMRSVARCPREGKY